MVLRRVGKTLLPVSRTITRAFSLGEKQLTLQEKFKTLGEGDVSFKKLKYQSHDIAVITLANDRSRNAMSGRMMVKLAEIVDELERWQDGKAVIMNGLNRTFCSGADLTVVRSILTHEEGEMMCSFMHDTVLRFKALPFISVAAVQGQALGGGAEASITKFLETCKEHAGTCHFSWLAQFPAALERGGAAVATAPGPTPRLKPLCLSKDVSLFP